MREIARQVPPDAAQASDTVEIVAGPDRPWKPGDAVDRYRIVRLIGMGGMARVYEATHEWTDRTVAIKIMHARYSRRPDVIERFRKEAIALSSINHPNVVAVDNGGLTEDGLVFIAMELLEGQTLREILRARRRLPVIEVLSLLVQVAEGVAAAHDRKVIHRDLKPENIFCTRAGGVKVLDLGLAKLIGYDVKETDPSPAAIMGTAAYMSPERLEAKPAGPGSDIYALGVIAYECLAGYHPLAPQGDWPSPAEIAHRALAYLPPSLTNVPPDLAGVVENAMHKSVARRFQSMRELERVLRELRDRSSRQHVPELTPSTAGRRRTADLMRNGERALQRKLRWPSPPRTAIAAIAIGLAIAALGAVSHKTPPAPLHCSVPALAAFAELKTRTVPPAFVTTSRLTTDAGLPAARVASGSASLRPFARHSRLRKPNPASSARPKHALPKSGL
jgi:serine/threonine protein kinase